MSTISESIREAALSWPIHKITMEQCLEGDIADAFCEDGEWFHFANLSSANEIRIFWLLVAEALK